MSSSEFLSNEYDEWTCDACRHRLGPLSWSEEPAPLDGCFGDPARSHQPAVTSPWTRARNARKGPFPRLGDVVFYYTKSVSTPRVAIIASMPVNNPRHSATLFLLPDSSHPARTTICCLWDPENPATQWWAPRPRG